MYKRSSSNGSITVLPLTAIGKVQEYLLVWLLGLVKKRTISPLKEEPLMNLNETPPSVYLHCHSFIHSQHSSFFLSFFPSNISFHASHSTLQRETERQSSA
jgi:hypothetical protein